MLQIYSVYQTITLPRAAAAQPSRSLAATGKLCRVTVSLLLHCVSLALGTTGATMLEASIKKINKRTHARKTRTRAQLLRM